MSNYSRSELVRSTAALRELVAVIDEQRRSSRVFASLASPRLAEALERARATLANAELQLVLSVTVTRPGPARRRTSALRVLVDVADEAYEDEFIASWELVKERTKQVLEGRRNLGGAPT